MEVTVKNAIFWDVKQCGCCKNTEVLEEQSTSIIRVVIIGELGMSAVTISYFMLQ
jgi:hypothetical protein